MSQAQEAYALLQEVDRLLANIEVRIQRIEGGAEGAEGTERLDRLKETLATFRQLERLVLRWLVLAQRLGLPEDITKAITIISKLIVVLRMWQMSTNLMMMSNPISAALGVAGLVGTVLSFSDIVMGY